MHKILGAQEVPGVNNKLFCFTFLSDKTAQPSTEKIAAILKALEQVSCYPQTTLSNSTAVIQEGCINCCFKKDPKA